MSRTRILFKTALILGLIGLLGGGAWLAWESRPPAGAGPGIIVFEVEKGLGVRAIAEALKDRALLRKSEPFVVLYRLFYHPRTIKAGEYGLPSGAGARDILETLLRGRFYLHPVTIAEGLTAEESFAVFLASGFGTRESFADAFRDIAEVALLDPIAADLEGYLFPETYRLPKGARASEILSGMVSQFKDVFGPDWRRRAEQTGMTLRRTVILASLIEKETGLPEEKPLVSAVFHNRLRIGMNLDCDPTVIYALKRAGPFQGPLRSKDLKFDSPYNTYLYPGLPPGPICNPGRASIEAALYPAAADYLYFVADRKGGHVFSRTLSEHQNAVRAYRGR